MPDGVTPPRMADEEVLLRAHNGPKYVPGRFDGVFDRGDLSGQGGDHSAADFALCCRLAYWTQDAAQIDRLFRRSGLMRAKWDEVHFSDGTTYGARTIANALADVSEHYSPPDGMEERRDTNHGGDCAVAVPELHGGRLSPAMG